MPAGKRKPTTPQRKAFSLENRPFFREMSDLFRLSSVKKALACDSIAEQVSNGKISKPENLAIAFGALKAARADSDPRAKESASRALAVLGKKMTEAKAVSVLGSVLKKSTTPFIRERAANAIGQIRSKIATRTLLDVLKTERNELVRLYCAEALRAINDPASFAEAEQLIKQEKSERVRFQLEFMLGKRH